MNRPSRTEDDLEHPDWNQMPPFLAPDLTTRQDLNGIANARVQRSRCSGAGAAMDGMLDEKGGMIGEFASPEQHRPAALPATGSGSHWLAETPVALKSGLLGGEGRAPQPSSLDSKVQSRREKLTGWVLWIASVVAMSTLMNMVGTGKLPSMLSGSGETRLTTTSPSSSLRRLSRRAGTCGSGPGPHAEYNTPLHVGALFIILAVSSIACATPLLAMRFPILRIPANALFAFRHIGTGVLLATAFVHLLPTAFISLGDPCLSSFWTSDYPAMPGAIALAGIFFVAIIEMIFSPARHYMPKPGNIKSNDDVVLEKSATHTGAPGGGGGHGHCSHAAAAAIITRPSRSPSAPIQPATTTTNNVDAGDESSSDTESQHPLHHVLTPEQQHKKSILQCMLLEVGILFHSVFIGMALSVSVGTDFVVLLIAIAFHQTFEGLALGARIATINWPKKTMQPYLMVLAYGCTTPIGQAIGLATHKLYDPSSEFGLILVGTMNAISSGLLVFASLVELLAEDFLSDESWIVLRGRKRVIACVLVFLGAMGMSVVGAWA
ncbi:putative transporter [Rhypophila decipiens]